MLTVEQIAGCGVVPVVVLEDAEQAVPTAKALLKGGINAMEITFRTAAAKASIAKVAAEVPEMIVGAGTVVNLEQLKDAVEAGAKFIVSPGTDPDIISEAARLDVAMMPGVVTPSEIILPGGDLRRAQGHQGAVRPVPADQIPAHGRHQPAERGGIFQKPEDSGRGRQLDGEQGHGARGRLRRHHREIARRDRAL